MGVAARVAFTLFFLSTTVPDARGQFISVCYIPFIRHALLRTNNYATSYQPVQQHSVGTRVTIICAEGYQISTSRSSLHSSGITSVCTGAGRWSPSLHGVTCTPVQRVVCKAPRSTGLVVSPSKSSYALDEIITYSCQQGYRLYGSSVGACSSSGSFSNIPVCQIITRTCNAPERNGLVISPLKSTYVVGESVTYSCRGGYKIIGKTGSACGSGGFFVDVPTCEVIVATPCSFPGQPNNGRTSPVQRTYPVGSTVVFQCNNGYALTGSQISTCQSSGQFSAQIPTCTRITPKQCPHPANPENGFVIRVSEMKKYYQLGESVMYFCEKGFSLIGASKASCTESGVFLPVTPECRREKTSCKFPGNPANGKTQPEKQLYSPGETVSFICNDGFVRDGAEASACLGNGDFSEKAALCVERQRKCAFPGDPDNGKTLPLKSSYDIDDEVSFSCNPGYEVDGAESATCLESGKFSEILPQCKIVVMCKKPELTSGGNIVIVSEEKEQYAVGEYIQFNCKSGYRLVGEDRLTCAATGIFESEIPTCEEIGGCKEPETPLNGAIIGDKDAGSKYYEGEEIGFECNEGYQREGTSTSTCIRDGDDYVFQPSPPICRERICSPPEVPVNGRIINPKEDDGEYVLGVEVIYACGEGYRLNGESDSTCSMNGGSLVFSPAAPSCERETCQPPESAQQRQFIPMKSIVNVGDELTFSCSSGYTLRGREKVTCIEQDLYSHDFPTCENIRCQRPNRLQNGRIDPYRGDYSIDEVITFTCRSGYSLQGSESATCTLSSEDEASFVPVSPTCERITCSTPSTPDGGSLFPSRPSYFLGDVVSFSCDQGYKLVGESEITCVAQDEFSDREPQCEIITCERPNDPTNGNIQESASRFEYRDTISYRCDEGYTLEGRNTRSCQDDGQFSFRSPTCREIRCQIPLFLRNGEVSPRAESSIAFGEVVRYSCRPGFNIVGAESAACQADGNLSEDTPRCEAITCDAPDLTPIFTYSPSRSKYAVGDVITFECSEGYVLRGTRASECLESGKFLIVEPRCDAVACSLPGPLLNGAISPPKSRYSFNEMVTYTCDDGYNLVGQESSTCGASGIFSGDLPACEPFTCPNPGPLRFGSIQPSKLNYRLGDTITFSCRRGYSLEGATVSRCQLGGKFSENLPLCSRTTCRLDGKLESGSIFPPKSQYFANDRITFTCDYGYELIGETFSVCGADGQFSEAVPRCKAITCSNPGAPKFGSIVPNQPLYNLGDDITYECDDGYVLKGSSVAYCMSENLFSASTPTCEEMDCSFPGNPINGFTRPVRVSYPAGTRINFECRSGYVIDGEESTRCGKGGRFEDSLPTCNRISCKSPGKPQFGEIYPDRVNYGLGQRVSFICDEGYELQGDYTIECEESGSFSGSVPVCRPITCSFPGNPDNGKTTPRKSSYSVNDAVDYECDDGYSLVGLESSRCTSNGQFSGFLPRCRVAFCDNPGSPKSGTITPNQSKYAVGETIEYSCNPGYEVIGASLAVCEENGEFSENTPVCREISCSFPGNPKNGLTSPTRFTYSVSDVVTFECLEGYEISGARSASCLTSGKFSESLPSCSEISCRNPGAPQFGSISPNLPSYPLNQRVVFSCSEGYELKGSRSATCEFNGMFSESVPVCERAKCDFPGNPLDGFTSPTKVHYDVGDTVTFECKEGFTLVGSETAECTEDNSFSADLPVCTRSTCSFPGRPKSGYTTPNKPVYAIGEEVSFSCRRGYRLDGSAASTCGDDGEFDTSLPSCIRATCKFPGNPENGDTSPTNAVFTFRQRVTFECREGFVLIGATSARCLVSGQFSSQLPSCQRVACSNPGSPRFGSIKPSRPTYSVDQEVTFSCNEGYELVGFSTATCLDSGEFSHPVPSCERVSCSFPGNPVNGVTSPTKLAYSVGEVVSFSCKDGYELVGVSSTECTKEGKFVEDLPSCERVTCRSLGNLLNGEVSPDLTRYAAYQKVFFSCRPGFYLVGEASSVCEIDGSFTNLLPKCVRRTCSNPGTPDDGSMSPDVPNYSVGQDITYTCSEGYRLEGNSVITCEQSGSFSLPIPVCKPIRCSFPGKPLRGSARPRRSSYSFGQEISYSCNSGYLLVGEPVSICGPDGIFLGSIPRCERNTCKNPGRPKFGDMSPDLDSYVVGQTIRYSCNAGYRLVGEETVSCEESGSFSASAPKCTPISCGFPGSPVNGRAYPRSASYSFGDLINFDCDDGYVLKGFSSARCTNSGEFSVSLPICEPRQCAFPGNPKEGSVTPTQVNYDVGDVVTYNCRSGYNLVGAKTRTCLAGGSFDGSIPTCAKKTCRNPGQPTNGYGTPNFLEYSIGQTITYACDTGYTLSGVSVSTCQRDGKFSDDVPTCERVPSCKNPGSPEFGSISSSRPFFDVKDTVRYSCEFGYRLEGTTEAECLPTGAFSAPRPKCQRIRCSFPGKPTNGVTSPQKKSYFLGETVNFVCNKGYSRVGVASSRCSGSGKFMDDVPSCNRVVCTNPGVPDFSIMTPNKMTYLAGETVKFGCMEGYRLEGRRQGTCGDDGEFIAPFPSCKRIVCQNPGIPAFGDIDPDLPRYVVESTVTYTCRKGYMLEGKSTAVCGDDGEFDNAPPICRRKTCRRPVVPEFGFISPSLSVYTVGQTVSYSCLPGYELLGEDTTECGVDGQFSNDAPECKLMVVTCDFPGNPENGATLPRKVTYRPGDPVQFQCDEGYVLFGTSSARCSTGGKFSENLPSCRSVTCLSPGRPVMGSIRPDTQNYSPGQRVTFSCNTGYTLKGATTTKCDYNGMFEDPVPTCERTTCRSPGKPDFGTMVPNRFTYAVGETITFSCSREYKLVGAKTTKCQSDGTFSNPVPTCTRLTTCSNPGQPGDGKTEPNFPSYTVGQKVTFSCSFGFKLTGSQTATCEENGQFSDPVPTCEVEFCKYPGRLLNGDMFPELPGYAPGQSIKFFCDTGFVLEGSDTTTCTGGVFTNPPPVCERITCSYPGMPANGKTVPRKPEYNINERIRYECDEGYQMVGADSALCTSSGELSEPVPLCRRTSCQPPLEPRNGKLTPLKLIYDVNDVVKFECDVGFGLVGKSSVQCLTTGSFSDPTPVCRKTTCSFPGEPENGRISPRQVSYGVQESVTYTCDSGYELLGQRVATCTETGDFSSVQPRCRRSTCDFPGDLLNGIVTPTQSSYEIREIVTYTCDKGYELIGQRTSMCTATGGFSTVAPRCRKVRCDFPGKPDNGIITPLRGSYELQQTVTYNCNRGYELVGQKIATCTNSGKFSSNPPRCRKATCSSPGQPENGRTSPNQLSYDIEEIVTFTCDDGYELIGQRTATCTNSGDFSSAPPRCRRMTCAYPGTPDNGRSMPRRSTYNVGDVVTYRCFGEYDLVGSKSATCMESGDFSSAPPLCEEKVVSCNYPGEPDNGSTSPEKNSYDTGDTVTYNCDTGYDLVGENSARCLKTGKFSSAPPRCRKTLGCSFPGVLENGSILPRKNIYDISDIVRYRCDAGYELIGKPSASCRRSGQFSSDPPRCRKSTCAFPGEPKNGRTVPFKVEYDINDEVDYECDAGYKLVGDRSARCQTTGEFTSGPPTCTSVRCSYPGAPAGGSTLPRRSSYSGGEIVEFKCNDDCLELDGSKTAICMPDGRFSQEMPTCQRKMCLDFPEIPEFGTLEPLQKNYTCGQKINYICSPGHKRMGSSFATCSSDGSFQEGEIKCEVVKCKQPPSLRNGFVTTNFGVVVFGTIVRYRCKMGYRLLGDDTITCGDDGLYVGDLPECQALSCRAPSAPKHGKIMSQRRSSWRVGDTVEFGCDDHYTLVGRSYTVCQSNGDWQNAAPRCEEPKCKGSCNIPRLRGRPCQCDSDCEERGDCCDDYALECTRGSCRGRCGETETSYDRCSCDDLCATRFRKACCHDYKDYCSVRRHGSPNPHG